MSRVQYISNIRASLDNMKKAVLAQSDISLVQKYYNIEEDVLKYLRETSLG